MADLGTQNGIYAELEDKYYSLLDWLQEKGVPVYKAVDAIEGVNIPSFPIAVILALLVLYGIFTLVSGTLGGAVLTVSVVDSEDNPLGNTDVTASFGGNSVSGKSGADGKVVLRVPLNTELGLRAVHTGYNTAEPKFTAKDAVESTTIVLQDEVTAVTRTINFVVAGTLRLLDEDFTAEFSCSGNDYSETRTVSAGTIDLRLQSDCDALTVRPSAGYSLVNSTVSFASGEEMKFAVEKAATGSGAAIATVSNSQGETISGIDVSLWSAAQGNKQGTLFETKQAGSNGTAVFSAVPSGRYYIVTYDRSGNYAEYDGLRVNSVQDIRAAETTSFAVVMGQSVAGKIRVLVKDKATGDAVPGATVRLSKGQSEITNRQTDNEGKVEFPVGEDVQYNIVVDKAGYLLASATVRPSADFRQIEIEQATAENSQSLLVTVVDEKDKPIENVRLKLRLNADGTQFGSEIVTGLDGRALFERVDDGTYYVYAVKPGYGEKTSDPVSVSSRQQNVLRLKLLIGTGKLDVSVIDEQGKPVAGAGVKAVDMAGALTLDEASTDSGGVKEFSLRADKKVFLIVSAEGFMQTTTVPVQMEKDVTLSKQVVLVKSVQSFEVKFLGLYAGDEAVSGNSGIGAGQKYTARFRMLVPKGALFDEAGIHIRTGSEQSTSMDKDFIYITGLRGAYNTLAEGTTYTPPTGQANDLQHQTTGSAKWANAVFRKAVGGVYEVEADVEVRDEAKIGSLLELWYRAWARSGGYLRSPADAALGTSESVPQKQGLYANALKATFSIGPTSLCGDDFCARYSIEDLREGLTSSVVDNYAGQVSSRYKLIFEVSSKSSAPFSASQLSIKDSTSSISMESYRIRTALGEERVGQRSGSEVSVAVGEIANNSVVGGEVIFEAKKEGTAPIAISIVSGSSEVYRKALYFKVLPAKRMQVDIVPKVIVPLINNNVLVHVSDENNAVSNAKVSVKKDGTVVASGETDIEGTFAYTLNSPSDGSIVGFAVEKAGYQPAELEIRVSGNILATDPKTIKLNMTVGGAGFKDLDASLLNYSQIPLVVEKVSASRDFAGFADVTFGEPAEGTDLAVDSNVDLRGIVTLGDRGKSIGKPTKVLGAVNVLVSNPNFRQKWLAAIPFELNIGFGDEVDDTECFSVAPLEWKMTGGPGEAKQFTISMRNACRIGGELTGLKDVSLRVVPGTDDVPGKFGATSSLEGARRIELDNQFRVIADNFREDGEGTVKLEFRPDDIVSGKAETRIEVRATHLTAAGPQRLTRGINVSISLNNLSQCVDVSPAAEITVNSCPYNTGFGNYGNNFSQYSNSRYGAYDPYQSRYGYGTGIPNYMGSAVGNSILGDSYYDYRGAGSYYNSYYPNTSYRAPFYPSEGINPIMGSAWACGHGAFQVRNSCASPVEVSFEAQAGINVKDKTVKIDPRDTADISVEPTNFFGRYALGIKARPADSSQKASSIRVLYVNVANEYAKNYRDCISISPYPTLSFSNFIPTPVTLKVINTCYDQGVFLDASNRAVQFVNSTVGNPTEMGINPARVTSNTGIPPIGAPSASTIPSAGANQSISMVQGWAFLNETTEQQANGRVSQVLEFEVVKNITEYYNRAPDLKAFTSESPFQQVGNLRYFLTKGYYAVNSRANVIVNFTTPYGGMRQTSFPLTLQDYWPLLEYADQAMKKINTYGDPNLGNPGKCINDDALNFLKVGHVSPEKSYSTLLNRNSKGESLFRISEKDGCGSLDKISEPFEPIDRQSFTKNGLTMTVTHDGHEATVSFTGVEEWKRQGGKETPFDTSMRSVVSRVSPAISTYHNFNVKITVGALGGAPGGGPGGGPGAVNTLPYDYACKAPDATSGLKAYQNYGFQHFSFEWRDTGKTDSGVQKDSCDSYDYRTDRAKSITGTDVAWFCDAVQSNISISKKLEDIKKVTALFGATGNGTCNNASFDCAAASNKRSGELFRYVLSQDADGTFLAADGKAADLSEELAAEKASDPLANALKRLKGKSASATDDTHNIAIGADGMIVMEELKKILKANQPRYTGAAIVLEWVDDNAMGKLKYLDLDKMYEVQRELAALNYKCPNDECYSAAMMGHKITLAETQKWAQGKWKLVAYNLSLSPEMKRLVMQDANWQIGSGRTIPEMAKYRNFYEFYRANIDTNMYLQNDKYAESLVRQLAEANPQYKARIGDATVKFEGAPSEGIAAGDYNVFMDYSWATSAGELTVRLGQNRNLKKMDLDNRTKYSDNPLFSMPIDAPAKWGIQINGAQQDTPYFYFNYYEGDVASPLNPQVSKKEGTVPVQFSYMPNYADTKQGRVLSITKSEIRYSPSDPVRLDLSVSKSGTVSGQPGTTPAPAPDSLPAGVLYEFRTKTANMTGVDSLGAKWLVTSANGISAEVGKAIASQKAKLGTLCPDEGVGSTVDYEGLVFSGAGKGKLTASAIVYTPVETNLSAYSTLGRKCIKDSATTLKSGYPNGSGGATMSAGANADLKLSQSNYEAIAKVYNLKKILELVKTPQDNSGKVCIKATPGEDKVEFYWNDAQLLGVSS